VKRRTLYAGLLATFALGGAAAPAAFAASAAPSCGDGTAGGFYYAACTVTTARGNASVGAHSYPGSTSNPDTTAAGAGYCDNGLGYGPGNPYCVTAQAQVNPMHADNRVDYVACYGIYSDSVCRSG